MTWGSKNMAIGGVHCWFLLQLNAHVHLYFSYSDKPVQPDLGPKHCYNMYKAREDPSSSYCEGVGLSPRATSAHRQMSKLRKYSVRQSPHK